MPLPFADHPGADPHGGDDVAGLIVDKVSDPHYPCLGARSVFNRQRATVKVYEELAGAGTAQQLLTDLTEFARVTDPGHGFASFVAAFRRPEITDERDFERMLWAQLQAIQNADCEHWNEDVSPNPQDEHFAFSAGGTAYFIVGLHPRASRQARRIPWPTLVFNLHQQFEALRRSGLYPRMRDTIRRRDEELQGSVNPMVADHGEISEARQYSGRRVGTGWEAPFLADGDGVADGACPEEVQ